MKKRQLIYLSILVTSAYSLSCVSSQKESVQSNPPQEVLPQHKEEVSAIYEECLGGTHGEMLQCIQKAVAKLEEDVPILTDSAREQTVPWQPSEEYVMRDNPTLATEANLARGAEIFKFYCSGCHGIDGRGLGAEINFGKPVADLTNLKLRERKDGELFWKITEGGWPMPAFWEGDMLSEDDIWVLIHYIRTLSVKSETK